MKNEIIKFDLKNEVSKLIVILNKEGLKNEFYENLDNLLITIGEEIDSSNYKIGVIKNKLQVLGEEILSEKSIDNLNIIKELIENELNKYELINDKFVDYYISQTGENGISFLCPDLDKRTGGIHAGKICTIVGGPGSMKTTYVTNICYEAIKQGKNVCFLSLEETPLDIYSKLLSRVSLDLKKNLSVQNITQHKLSDAEQQILIEEVYPHLESLKGTFYLLGENDLGDFSQLTIEKKMKVIDELIKSKSINKENGDNHGIDILVVDHLQMFKYVDSKKKDEFQLMNSYVSFFRRQSKNFLSQDREIAVILLSQSNREGIAFAQKNDGMYSIIHIAEASEIERASSYIISTYTDAGLQMSKQIKIGVIKLRGAPLPMSTINTYADGEFYNVGEVPIQEIQSYDIDYVTKEPEQALDFKASLDKMLIGLF